MSSARPWRGLLAAALIVAAGCWVFWPALRGGWLWDDNLEVAENPVLRDPAGLGAIWSGSVGPDYFPLKASLQWVLWRAWPGNPTGFHVASLALHLVSALLLWRVLGKLGLRLAWLGGLLFAVHPLTVESVAWISELKNTASLPFLLLSVWAYLNYDESGRRADYSASLGLFLAALLCKTSVVMLPFVLLLHAWWKWGRIGRPDLKDSAPFFGLSLALGLVTIWFQHHRAIGEAEIHLGGFLARTVGAGLAFGFYLAKSLWPSGLLPVYPRWPVLPASPWQLLPWPLLAAGVCWFWTKRATWGRHVLFGLGFFLLNLAPVLGFIPMSYLRIAWVADHFAYLPLVGLIGLAIAGAGAGLELISEAWRPVAVTLAAAAVLLLSLASRDYAGIFRDPGVFWTYTVQRNPDAWPAQNNLGVLAFQNGRYAEAEKFYAEAIRLKPDYAEARFNLGEALFRLDRVAEAAEQFAAALKLRPDYPEALNDLGSALWRLQRIPEALAAFREAVRLRPALADPHANLGGALLELQQFPEAISQLEEALRLQPDRPDALYNLGNACLRAGRLGEAATYYERAVQLRPDFAEARNNLGGVLLQLGRAAEAVTQFEAVLQLRPADEQARQNLIQARATIAPK